MYKMSGGWVVNDASFLGERSLKKSSGYILKYNFRVLYPHSFNNAGNLTFTLQLQAVLYHKELMKC